MGSRALVLCLALSGCLTAAVPARLAVQSRAAHPAVCASKAECDTAWSEAIEWVSQRCAFPIKKATQSPYMVETEGPLGAPSNAVACRLQRNLGIQPGTEQIELTPSCGNWFDCSPERVYFQAAFNDQLRTAIDEMHGSARSPQQ